MGYANLYEVGGESHAPYNQVEVPAAEVWDGQCDIECMGINYYVAFDSGHVTVCFADCERNRDLRGWIPNKIYDRVVELARDHLRRK